MIGLATKVLKDYSKVLATLEPEHLGFAETFLPHSKTAIREATRVALANVGADQPAIREALIRGFIYLEQFVPEPEAEVLITAALQGDADADPLLHAQAQWLLERIRADMQNALIEISAFQP